MGPGKNATSSNLEVAFEMGKKLADQGYIVLTGGRAAGVMEAALKGAKSVDGTTIGVLPSEDGNDRSEFVDIPILTGIGSARNNINVLTSDIVIGIGCGPGTASEIALAIKAGKRIILINQSANSLAFFQSFGYDKLFITNNVQESLDHIKHDH